MREAPTTTSSHRLGLTRTRRDCQTPRGTATARKLCTLVGPTAGPAAGRSTRQFVAGPDFFGGNVRWWIEHCVRSLGLLLPLTVGVEIWWSAGCRIDAVVQYLLVHALGVAGRRHSDVREALAESYVGGRV